jgi:hypothetical protein
MPWWTFISVALVFATVIASSTTLTAGVFTVMVIWKMPSSDEALLEKLGWAINISSPFGFIAGFLPAVALAVERATGVNVS